MPETTDQDIYTLNWQQARQKALSEGLIVEEMGWEQHVIIDKAKGIVYRYPRHEAAAAKLEDEVAVLHHVNEQTWPVRLPVMLEHGPIFTSYEYIPGAALSPEWVARLDEEQAASIGSGIGNFLVSFHRLDKSIVEHKKTRHRSSLFEYYRSRIVDSPASDYTDKARLVLDQLEKSIGETDSVVTHGDLHGPNIIVDPETHELNGIIDLSEMEIGDPHQEFRKIYMTVPEALDSALASYMSDGGQPIDRDVVILWAQANEWANACFYAGQDENITYRRALEHLQKWGQL